MFKGLPLFRWALTSLLLYGVWLETGWATTLFVLLLTIRVELEEACSSAVVDCLQAIRIRLAS